MGKRSEFDRNERDWYATPIKAVYPIAPLLKDKVYVEPFAGDGRLIEHIRMLQPTATCAAAFDLEPQISEVTGLKLQRKDFNDTDLGFWETVATVNDIDYFVSNPPWLNDKTSGYQLQKIIHMLSKVRPTLMLMNGNFAFNKRSAKTMMICTDVIPVGRLKWIEGSPHSGKDDCAWFRFDSTSGETQLTYMHPREV